MAQDYKYVKIGLLILVPILVIIAFAQSTELRYTSSPVYVTISQPNGSGLWNESGTELLPYHGTLNLQIPALANCDSIDTDINGVLSCGVDAGGTLSDGGTFNSSYANISKGLLLSFITSCDILTTDSDGNVVCGSLSAGSNFQYSNITEFFGVANASMIKSGNSSWVLSILTANGYNKSIDLSGYNRSVNLSAYNQTVLLSSYLDTNVYPDVDTNNLDDFNLANLTASGYDTSSSDDFNFDNFTNSSNISFRVVGGKVQAFVNTSLSVSISSADNDTINAKINQNNGTVTSALDVINNRPENITLTICRSNSGYDTSRCSVVCSDSDCTQEINSSIAKLGARGGGSIFIGPGIYPVYTTKQGTGLDNVSIYIPGYNNITIRGSGVGTTTLLQMNNGTTIKYVTNSKYLSMSDFTIDQSLTEDIGLDGQSCIKGAGTQFATIKDVALLYCGRDGFYPTNNGWGHWENIFIYYPGRMGMVWDSDDLSTSINIKVWGAPDRAYYIVGGTTIEPSYTTIIGGQIWNSSYNNAESPNCIHVEQAEGVTIQGVKVKYCGSQDTNSPASSLRISNSKEITVSGMLIEHSTGNGTSVYNSEGVNINGNQIVDSMTSCDGIGAGISLSNTKFSSVHNNYIGNGSCLTYAISETGRSGNNSFGQNTGGYKIQQKYDLVSAYADDFIYNSSTMQACTNNASNIFKGKTVINGTSEYDSCSCINGVWQCLDIGSGIDSSLFLTNNSAIITSGIISNGTINMVGNYIINSPSLTDLDLKYLTTYLSFDDYKNKIAFDSTKNNLHAYNNKAFYNCTNSVIGCAFVMKGNPTFTDFLNISNPSNLSILSSSGSYAAWVYVDKNYSMNGPVPLVYNGWTTAQAAFNRNETMLVIRNNVNATFSLFVQGSSTCLVDSKHYSFNTWHYVVGTWDNNSACAIYVDGQFQANDTSFVINTEDAGYYNAEPWVLIGKANQNFGAARLFNGTIDEISIWNKSLSPTEVKTLYYKGVNKVKLIETSSINKNTLYSDGININLTKPTVAAYGLNTTSIGASELINFDAIATDSAGNFQNATNVCTLTTKQTLSGLKTFSQNITLQAPNGSSYCIGVKNDGTLNTISGACT